MHVFFEDDGQLKAGTVLADNDTSLQVEAASGKRLKIKAAAVLLRFAEPSPSALSADAQELARDLDPNFLWEVCADEEFGFAELAREYFGRSPAPPEAAAVALALSGAPMYFYKRGKGRYRKAPPDALKAALASVERKKRDGEQMAAWSADLAAHRLPDAFRAKLADAAAQAGQERDRMESARCRLRRAADQPGSRSSRNAARFRRRTTTTTMRFWRRLFPRGVAFPAWGTLPPLPELPTADVRAFSIDDATTTEIDDAFSVRELANGHYEVGIHIAAPALAIPRGSPLDAVARERLSTVYMPGRKITMLPDAAIDAFTLAAGHAAARAVDVCRSRGRRHAGPPRDAAQSRSGRSQPAARCDRRHVRERDLPSPVRSAMDTGTARAVEVCADAVGNARQGRLSAASTTASTSIGTLAPDGRVAIVPRPRGSPLDKLVSELMIFVNSTWGKVLDLAHAPGLYRTQASGKVKMSTRAAEHQGLGLSHYLWASSPLRRYSDLVNQRQLIAVVAGEKPPYAENDAELYAALVDFEATYSIYADFQDRMEHYWCLRWLLQEGVTETAGTVIRENLVRFDRLPLIVRLADLPPQAPDTPVRIAIGRIDLISATLECRSQGVGA